MGKKAKTNKGKKRAETRKLDPNNLPPPPTPLENEVGSAKLLDAPNAPGTSQKALNQDGYDDGGVADLTLVIDLEDMVLRRKRGDAAYYSALTGDLLPRVTTGALAKAGRREQKIQLAKLLFQENDNGDDDPSEVYIDNVDGSEDAETKNARLNRLKTAKHALSLSTILREPACTSLSLAEISKRYLNCYGKEGAEAALRCAEKAIIIASDGFYDNDTIAMEAQDEPKVDPNYEINATVPGLSHPTSLKLYPARVSILCQRSAYLHHGNALRALGRDTEARESYSKVLPMLEDEPRCGRLDWERVSLLVNIGNTHAAQGKFDEAYAKFDTAEKFGREHVDVGETNRYEGIGILITAMRAKSFALKKAGDEGKAKELMREVIGFQMEHNKLKEEKKQKELEAKKAEETANDPAKEDQ